MSHIPIIISAIEALEAKMTTPPTQAQINLLEALEASDVWYHDNEENTEVTAQIDDECTSITGYCNAVQNPSDIRLQGHADALNGLIT